MVDEIVEIFDGQVNVNQLEVTRQTFEWRPATMKHKVMERIDERPVDAILLKYFNHATPITNSLFSMLATLNRFDDGLLEELKLEKWYRLDEKVSKTALLRFTTHFNNLQALLFDGSCLKTEVDRANMCDLASKLIELQTDHWMRKLSMQNFTSK